MEIRPPSVSFANMGRSVPPAVVRSLLDGTKCCAIGLGFVASLYLWSDSRGPLHAIYNLTEAATDLRYFYDREHPINIRKRSISTAWVGVAGTAYLCYQLGKESSTLPTDCLSTVLSRGSWKLLTRHLLPLSTPKDILVAMGVTTILFSGVITTKLLYKDERAVLSEASDDSNEDSSQELNVDLSSSSFDADVVDSDEESDGKDDTYNQDNNPISRVESFVDVAQPKGPAIRFPKSQRRDTRPLTERRRRWQFLRNYVICPLVEEILFRAVMWKVVTAKSEYGPLHPVMRVGIIAFAFGVSHVHHVLIHAVRIHQNTIDPLDATASRRKAWNQAFITSGAQIVMTSVFSLFNTFVYTRLTAENILVSALVHSFVNYLGPPSTAYLYRQEPFIKASSRHASVDSIAFNERVESTKKSSSLRKRIILMFRRAKRTCLEEPVEWKVRKKTNVITGFYYAGIAAFGVITIANLAR